MKSLSILLVATACINTVISSCIAADEKTVVATVNDQSIYESDVTAKLVSQKIPRDQWPEMRKAFTQQLINESLLRDYLEKKKVVANPIFINQQVAIFRRMAKAEKKTLKELLEPLSLTEKSLREQIALPLAWAAYSRRVISEKQISDHFKSHKEQFDGTKVQARQIYFKTNENQLDELKEKMSNLRTKIVAESMTFEDAAKEFSQSPSASKGGDLGTFQYRGRMPSELSQAAFALKAGEVSQPLETKFGLHLIQTTKRIPGQFSLEDARKEIFELLSNELKKSTLEQLNQRAKIDWVE